MTKKTWDSHVVRVDYNTEFITYWNNRYPDYARTRRNNDLRGRYSLSGM